MAKFEDTVPSPRSIVITEHFFRVYEGILQEAGQAPDDRILTRGLQFLREAESANFGSDTAHNLLKQLARSQAMYALMVTQALDLKEKMLALEERLREEVRRTPELQERFQALQAEAEALDPSLLDLRDGGMEEK